MTDELRAAIKELLTRRFRRRHFHRDYIYDGSTRADDTVPLLEEMADLLDDCLIEEE
jgi:hypothetical protein